MPFESLIPKIVSGFDIAKGDIVLLQLWGENADLPLLDTFAIEVAKTGGIPVKWQYSRAFLKRYFSDVPAENLEFPDKFFEIFKPADVVVDILTYSPAPAPDFPRDRVRFFGKYMQKLFPILTGKKAFIQVKVPTRENAAETGVGFETYRAAVIKALDIDYAAVKRNCTTLVDEFRGADQVVIATAGNNRFTCSLKGRDWYKDDGAGDVPCGEVYISPLEESGEGTLFVPEIFLDGSNYANVTLTFSKGKLTGTSDPTVLEFIRSAPGDCDMLGEFGIGLNPGVTALTGYAGTDEKCIGTVHVAVGWNTAAGGRNKTPSHVDFIIRPQTVMIDGKAVMAEGKFTGSIGAQMAR
ncbi:MAG TPA: aminopeptidase [Candidatus Edwardsbacteria bacterium]|nr:aminopeptidase [Candidatus Edwardsbacteria bacterium]